MTNSVKHFKFVQIERGRRPHKKPTAAQTLLGKEFRVTQQRGMPIQSEPAEAIVATVHPSAILRAPDDGREQAKRVFIADLERVAAYLQRPRPTTA